MSAPPDQAAFGCTATSLDDIATFLGSIPPAEYEARRRIRGCKNAAAFLATQAESADARTLCWMVCDNALRWIYAAAPISLLGDRAQFLRRLLMLANQAEDLEARL